MKKSSLVIALILLFAVTALTQERSNDDINRQIRSLGVDRINVTFDAHSGTSKLMAVAENFSNRDADNAGVQAINFAMAFFYPGTSLRSSAESIHLTFWVLTKKPRFAENHHLTVDLDGRNLDLGTARYAAKPAQNMEYLNFDIPRTDLTSIGSAAKVTFHVGAHRFTATQSELKLIRAVTRIADISVSN